MAGARQRGTVARQEAGGAEPRNLPVEVVTKDPNIKGFSVVKRRRVVERTLGWLMHHRRLVRDYEARTDNSAIMITIAND